MTLLVAVADLEFGGGQAFAVRLAEALSREMRVLLTSTDSARVDPRFTARIATTVRVIINEGGPSGLARIVADEGVTAVNTHLWWADKTALAALRELPVHWVVSMHGCYEILLPHPEAEPGFQETALAVLSRADRVVIAAEKNRRVFERFGLSQERVVRIPYGFEPRAPQSMRRPASDVVFGIVSRGVVDKGWEQSFRAFRAVRARLQCAGMTASLVFVGDGPVADAIRQRNEPDVHVMGWSAEPEEHIAGFDIALLPTSFAGESFPNSIIEYLAQGKPVIATRWAEIPEMVGEDAAVLIGFGGDGKADVDALREAMIALALDAPRRRAMGAAGLARSQRFSMPECAARYGDALRRSQARPLSTSA